MEFNELLELLEIDSPEEFGYFENFATLIECDEEITYDVFFKMLKEVDSETLIDLTNNYFEDILQGIPNDSIDIYTLLSTINQALVGFAKASSTNGDIVVYIDELFRFRNWYMFESVVYCKKLGDSSKKEATLSEALSLCRAEKLSYEKYRYDFSECLDYEIDEYSISIDVKIDEEYKEVIEEDEDIYDSGLIDKEFPVIDGDFFEEEKEDENDEF